MLFFLYFLCGAFSPWLKCHESPGWASHALGFFIFRVISCDHLVPAYCHLVVVEKMGKIADPMGNLCHIVYYKMKTLP